jgi:colicin import membrane protein
LEGENSIDKAVQLAQKREERDREEQERQERERQEREKEEREREEREREEQEKQRQVQEDELQSQNLEDERLENQQMTEVDELFGTTQEVDAEPRDHPMASPGIRLEEVSNNTTGRINFRRFLYQPMQSIAPSNSSETGKVAMDWVRRK